MGEIITANGYENRLLVPEMYKSWDVEWPEYDPPVYTDNQKRQQGLMQGWWHDGNPKEVDYSACPTHTGTGIVRVDANGYPMHPDGRQGLRGQGVQGSLAATFAGDAITFHDKVDSLDVLMVKRKSGLWAWPGGVVDPGESIDGLQTAVREQKEETGIQFDSAIYNELYRGTSGDPRDTDWAWWETVAHYTVLGPNAQVDELNPDYDEVDGADWKPVNEVLDNMQEVYAAHGSFLIKALSEIGYRNPQSDSYRLTSI
jgi:ADP-ribose pyrophosphatase YjhB (NUDIX family)